MNHQITQRISEAQWILKELGFPPAQSNERSALAFLALLDVQPDMPWAAASTPLRGITEMMKFMRVDYGKDYAPNTRETVRRQTIHQFCAAGLATKNPDPTAPPTAARPSTRSTALPGRWPRRTAPTLGQNDWPPISSG
ncbi:hypothetical protein [Candidatus Poriferisodalis sp.]|uniref:hypothetical protein n=1 Tax=Candidatus Poriferisodalis sp. TaxID=3101277 RepID=UPI003B51C1EF